MLEVIEPMESLTALCEGAEEETGENVLVTVHGTGLDDVAAQVSNGFVFEFEFEFELVNFGCDAEVELLFTLEFPLKIELVKLVFVCGLVLGLAFDEGLDATGVDVGDDMVPANRK